MTITMTTIITMTSIAITTITTAIPMLMTTSKPRPGRGAARRCGRLPSNRRRADAGSRSGMQENEAAALYRLMTWLSPSFPVGAFSYSSGIEWAVEAGDIVDAASLRDWLASMLADGPGFCDGMFLAHAHRAASSGDDGGACARSPSSLRPSCPRASASLKPRRRAAPSSRSRARHGIAMGWIG